MISKSRASFLRKPVHKIPCHQLDCDIVLRTRSYNQKYCHKHSVMARMKPHQKKNIRKRQKDISSPYGHFFKMTKRNCLKCGESFGSTGKFHKVCEPCNQENELVVRKAKNSGISNISSNSSFLTTSEQMEHRSTW